MASKISSKEMEMVWKTPTLQYTIRNSSYLCRLVMMLGAILPISRISRTDMVMRTAVRRLLRSLAFLFLMTMMRKRRLRKMPTNERTDQPAHHHAGLGMTWGIERLL